MGAKNAIDPVEVEVAALMAREAEAQGLSVRAIGEAIGVGKTRVGDLLNGLTSWTVTDLQRTCELLGLEPGSVLREAEAAVAARERGVAVSVSSDGDSAASSSNGDAGGLPPEWELAASRGRDSRAEVAERLGFRDDLGEESQVSPEED